MFEEQERRRSESLRHLENKGRLASVYARYKTTGSGTMTFSKRVDFGLIFIEEPFMSYGCSVDLDEIDNASDSGPEDDNDDETYNLPQCTGFVTEWDQDERGYYRGAYVAVSILPIGAGTELVEFVGDLRHYFTFAANAIKDFPVPDVDDDDS